MSPSIDETGMWVLMIYAIVLIVVGIFALASYIVKGIGMYTIAKRQGQENPWLAFVPFARTYLHGELAGSITLKEKKIKSPGIWLLAMPFIYGAVFSIFYVIILVFGVGIIMKLGSGYGHYGFTVGAGGIMGIIILALILIVVSVVYKAVYKVLGILVNRQIFRNFTSDNMSIAHAVLSAVVPLYESICMFVMRNRPYNPGMEPQAEDSYGQESHTQAPLDGAWRPVEEPERAAGHPAKDDVMPGQYREAASGEDIVPMERPAEDRTDPEEMPESAAERDNESPSTEASEEREESDLPV